jgi:replication factor A1
MVHGTQTGVRDLRIKAVLDDGSDALMAVFNSDLTTKLLGKTLEECEKDLTEVGPDYLNVLSDELNDILLLHPIRLRGTVTTDDYGAMMICTDFDELVLSEEISERIDHLLKKHDLDDSEPEVL